MRELLLQLADMGKTLIVTSHILPELARICNMVAIITHGKLRAFGTQADIMRQVSQRRTIEVQLVENDQLPAAGKIVSSFFDAEAEVTLSEPETIVRFDADLPDRELANILAALVDKGVAVAQYREIPTDLEDAFLSVTSQPSQTSPNEPPAATIGSQEPE